MVGLRLLLNLVYYLVLRTDLGSHLLLNAILGVRCLSRFVLHGFDTYEGEFLAFVARSVGAGVDVYVEGFRVESAEAVVKVAVAGVSCYLLFRFQVGFICWVAVT